MRKWIIPVVSLAVLAACGETTTQRTGTGAAGGAVAGAVVGGPVGAVVGAGVGAVAGANREKIDEKTDQATDATKEKVAEASDKIENKMDGTDTARSADRVAGPTNAQVKDAQTSLKELGLYDGEIDGIYGKKTIRAVSDFQANNELPKTGTLTSRTREKLQQVASADMKSNSAAPASPSNNAAPASNAAPMTEPTAPPAATPQESQPAPGTRQTQ